jgi:voltage-dependent calcium channel L type alpha-1D
MKGGVSPRTNFDETWSGFITIFIVIIGDDWQQIMYDYYRVLHETKSNKSESYFAVVFFMVLYIAGNIVLLNLFLAILLANFETKAE